MTGFGVETVSKIDPGSFEDVERTLRIITELDTTLLHFIATYHSRLHLILNKKEILLLPRMVSDLHARCKRILQDVKGTSLDVQISSFEEIRAGLARVDVLLRNLGSTYVMDHPLSRDEWVRLIFHDDVLHLYGDAFSKFNALLSTYEPSNQTLKEKIREVIADKSLEFTAYFRLNGRKTDQPVSLYLDAVFRELSKQQELQSRLLLQSLSAVKELMRLIDAHELQASSSFELDFSTLKDSITTLFLQIKDAEKKCYDPLEHILEHSRLYNKYLYEIIMGKGFVDNELVKESYRVLGEEKTKQLIKGIPRSKEEKTQTYLTRIDDMYKQYETEQNQKLFLDKLTQLPRRETLEQFFNELFREYISRKRTNAHEKRTRQNYALLYFDLDKFKKINDKSGHDVGDEVLRRVADIIKTVFRRSEDALPVRFGGEEFVCVLKHVDLESTLRLAEELRRRIWSLADKDASVQFGFSYDQTFYQLLNKGHRFLKRNLTVSIGIIYFDDVLLEQIETYLPQITEVAHHDTELKVFLSLADYALYVAKRSGRNKVVCANIHDKSARLVGEHQEKTILAQFLRQWGVRPLPWQNTMRLAA